MNNINNIEAMPVLSIYHWHSAFVSSLVVFTHMHTYWHTCDHESLGVASETVSEKPRQHGVAVRDVHVPLTPRTPVTAVTFTVDTAAIWPRRWLPRLHDRPLGWFINTVHLAKLKKLRQSQLLVATALLSL